MPRMVVLNPEFDSQSCELTNGTFVVGRGPGSHILIQDDSLLDEHCELWVWGNEIIVRRRDARGDVGLDGAPIAGQSGIRHGQVLRLGQVEIRLELEPSGASETTPISAVHELRQLLRQTLEKPTCTTSFRVLLAPRR